MTVMMMLRQSSSAITRWLILAALFILSSPPFSHSRLIHFHSKIRSKCLPSPLESNSPLSPGRNVLLLSAIWSNGEPKVITKTRREWRMKWSADEDKASLVAAQAALEAVLPTIKALPGFQSVQRVVCGGCLDFKVSATWRWGQTLSTTMNQNYPQNANRLSSHCPPNNSACGERPPSHQKLFSWKQLSQFPESQASSPRLLLSRLFKTSYNTTDAFLSWCWCIWTFVNRTSAENTDSVDLNRKKSAEECVIDLSLRKLHNQT